MEGLAVVVPAYQAGHSIETVVAGISAYAPSVPVIVVDDGSTDDTADCIARSGAELISHDRNRGKGAALLTAFRLLSKRNVAAAITIDADCQHQPSDIPRFIECWKRFRPDIIVGTRIKSGSAMPYARRASNMLSSLMTSRLASVRISDSQSGFRLYSRRVWDCLEEESAGYELETDVLITAARLGMEIGEVPIATVYGNEQSEFQAWRDTRRISGVFWKQFRRWF